MNSKFSKALHSMNFTTAVAIATTTAALSMLIAPNSAQAVNLIANDSFEASFSSSASTATDGIVVFDYQPTGSGVVWDFAGTGTGVGNSNALAAYDGQTFAFLRNTSGLLSQTFSVGQATNATLNFALALRASYEAGQSVNVLLDNQSLSSFTATTTNSWTSETLDLGLLSAGTHTISFQGLYAGNDSTAFIDAINVSESTAVPEPFTIIGTLIGGTAAARMRKKLKDTSK